MTVGTFNGILVQLELESTLFLSINEINISILEKPHAPSKLRIVETNATSFELTWIEGWKGNSPIIRYIIEGNNETGFANDRNSEWFDALIVNDPFKIHALPPVIIEGLRPATTYRFRVKAVNKVGASPFSKVSADISTAETRKSVKDF